MLVTLPSLPTLPTPCPARRYQNTERRQALLKEKGIFHIGMGVSGGEEGARRGALGPSCCLVLPSGRQGQCAGKQQGRPRAHSKLPELRCGALRCMLPRGRQSVRCKPCLARLPGSCAAGPSMMPGGDPEAYKHLQPIVEKVAAQVGPPGAKEDCAPPQGG